ncbi:MAG TPA: hypothetical protein DCS35_17335 [Vibrio sp.]|uniref:hypothetical protein n=1 Tax=Pseudomonas sp. C27(2019) TaxID=2604941 RepID=UPI000E864362|nr:hypothetical protein [Pseudomonas sp. C27(2019)]QEY59083.1 hypothetical protein FXF61_07805 [Pseudomonas sp. C27(2019)]HAS64164.1 hypothetical protein [Vibrio sp.]
MKVINRFAKLGLILGITAALVACGDNSDNDAPVATSTSTSSGSSSATPSDEAMRAAVDKSFKKELEQMAWLATLSGADTPSAEMMPTLDSIATKGCEAFDESIYRCAVTRTISSAGNTETDTRFYYFHKSETGDWIFIY